MTKPTLVLNFNNHKLSGYAKEQLQTNNIINMPLEVDKNTNIGEYIDNLLDNLNIETHRKDEEWQVSILVVPPGLPILATLVGRNLSERMIPYNVVNLIRSSETGQFIVKDIY